LYKYYRSLCAVIIMDMDEVCGTDFRMFHSLRK